MSKLTKEDLDNVERRLNTRGLVTTALYEIAPELLRLARLGLWAEEFGIPALETMAGCNFMMATYDKNTNDARISRPAHKALKALHKEGGENE